MPPSVQRSARFAATLLACVATVGVVTFPLAVERGLEDTVVHQTIGVVPATLTLTGSSNSRLELGLLGSLILPLSRGPLGIQVTVDGPPATVSGGESVTSFFTPELVEVYSGLFHDPQASAQGYVAEVLKELREEVLRAGLLMSVPGGVLLMLLLRILDPRLRRRLAARRLVVLGTAVPVALAASTGVAWLDFQHWSERHEPRATTYTLPSLDGTAVEGAVTDSAVLRLALEDAVPKLTKLIDRQESRTGDYVSSAVRQLEELRPFMAGPGEDEVAIMMQSDMHCSAAMIELQRRVVQMLGERHGAGTVSLVAVTGDLTTNGTAAERGCIRDEAAISEGAPVVAVSGNHESDLSAQQMADAGMHVLDGSTKEYAGTTVLGEGDPSRTEMFGATRLRGEATQRSVGKALYDVAVEDRPDLVLVHEAYAAQAFIGGVDDMRGFLDERGSDTTPREDGVRDLPASAVFYGHWHRDVPPRVVWNSDGTWTLVMELNTSAGAIASPTLNHFSTPWSPPQQLASFPVIFKNRATRLVTGYQMYSFSAGGTVTVDPVVPVGVTGAVVTPAQPDTAAADAPQRAGSARRAR